MTIEQYRREQHIVLIIVVIECLFNISVLYDPLNLNTFVNYLILPLIFGLFYAGYRYRYLRMASSIKNEEINYERKFYESEYRKIGIEASSYLIVLTIVVITEFAIGEVVPAIINLLMYGYGPTILEVSKELKAELG